MATVMVVDDDLAWRALLLNLLQLEGHKVVTAENGLEALKILMANPAPALPDLMLVDLDMAQMNGYELVRALRGDHITRELPIVMLSGTAKDVKATFEAEGVSYMPKSMSNKAIVELVRKYVRPPAAPPGRRAEAIASGVVFETPAVKAETPPPELPNLATAPPPSGVYAASRPAQPAPVITLPGAGAPVHLVADENLRRMMAHSKDLAALVTEAQEKEQERKGTASIADDTPIISLVQGFLIEAIKQGASDVHVEAQADGVRIRYRIDGVLQTVLRLPSALHSNIAARLKVMASLDITEHRLPQDGRFTLRLADETSVEFRLSSLPSAHGEKIALRLLRQTLKEQKLSELFARKRDLKAVQESLQSPVGLILVTGPTGGGKTTTLYAMIETLNTPGRNITTVEDPIEREIAGITQVAVRPGIGLTFEAVLRACLRQDPNILLVGEIRDVETAEIALRASITGHLVLSTLHTNDAPSTVTRLIDMGIAPFLIASALKLVVAQRLLRVLCPYCKIEDRARPEELGPLTSEERTALGATVFRPKGCEKCRGIGYLGRAPIIEVMPVNTAEMRKHILDAANPEDLRWQAISEGMVSLRQGALDLVARGETSVEEAMTVYFLSE